MSKVASVRHISRCTIKPRDIAEESLQPCYLTPWDLSVLSADYIQKVLLFKKPQVPISTIIDQLKDSLSRTLTHFFPLSGHLMTKKGVDPPSYLIFIDCTDPPGAEFVYARSDGSISGILASTGVPPMIDYLFVLDKPMNHDGHTLPLLAVQVTELIDGISIGCSFNHVAGDGTSFWNFMNAWSEICRENITCASHLPVTERWFLEGRDRIINLPYSHQDEFIDRYVPPTYRERVFHFSPQSISQLKAMANSEFNNGNIFLSSFQALAAHIWRSITRARGLPGDQKTICWITIDDRSRLDPPLSKEYFGNCILALTGTTTAGELLQNDLGWSAMILHQAIADHTNAVVRASLDAMMKAPYVYQFAQYVDNSSLAFGSSPRFEVFGNDFGWGKPVAVRSGYGNKFDGKVTLYPGCQSGSVDMELCLLPKSMSALENDEEFMATVSQCC